MKFSFVFLASVREQNRVLLLFSYYCFLVLCFVLRSISILTHSRKEMERLKYSMETPYLKIFFGYFKKVVLQELSEYEKEIKNYYELPVETDFSSIWKFKDDDRFPLFFLLILLFHFFLLIFQFSFFRFRQKKFLFFFLLL